MRQVLQHLIANAVKFTDKGSISVRVNRLLISPGRPGLHFVVTDTGIGIGITGEQQSQLFQPFFQGDDSTTRRHGGAGLGLESGPRRRRPGRLRSEDQPRHHQQRRQYRPHPLPGPPNASYQRLCPPRQPEYSYPGAAGAPSRTPRRGLIQTGFPSRVVAMRRSEVPPTLPGANREHHIP